MAGLFKANVLLPESGRPYESTGLQGKRIGDWRVGTPYFLAPMPWCPPVPGVVFESSMWRYGDYGYGRYGRYGAYGGYGA